MKKAIAILLTVCICCSVLACSKDEAQVSDDTADAISTEQSTTPEEVDPIMTVTQTYLSAEMMSDIEKAFSEDATLLHPLDEASAYYAPQDFSAFSGKTLSAITIPVCRTAAADAQGNFALSVGVFDSSENGMMAAAKRTYTLSISASEYGLAENATVAKMIRVDVSALSITLSENETLGFYAKGDTLIPGYLNNDNNAVRAMLCDKKPMALGCLTGVGSAEMAVSLLTLPFDYTFTYTGKQSTLPKGEWELDEEYALLAEEFKSKYAGKTVSILGDSISTWGGISDYPPNQLELMGNGTYYGRGSGTNLDRLPSSEATWWGRLIRDTGLKLCVNNSCSGASVYGVAGGTKNHEKSAIERSSYLHTNDGKKPDLILFYMSTNDAGGKPWSDLFTLLQSRGNRTEREVIDSWFAKVLEKTNNGSNCVVGSTYTTFEQAYALTLYNMKQTYKNADIVCIGLMFNKANTEQKVVQYNVCMKALATYFGAVFIDPYESTDMSAGNRHGFTVDENFIHPNAAGHYQLTKALLSKILGKTGD